MRIASGKSLSHDSKERYLTMDRLSSIALVVLGSMALAESCGVAVQSVITVGGIGGQFHTHEQFFSMHYFTVNFHAFVCARSTSTTSNPNIFSKFVRSQMHLASHKKLRELWRKNHQSFARWNIQTSFFPIAGHKFPSLLNYRIFNFLFLFFQEWPRHSQPGTYWETL